MDKSPFTSEYSIFLSVLRRSRKSTGITQAQLARRLGETQSFISKCERGERRIDVIELRRFCQALGISLSDFMWTLQRELEQGLADE